MSDNLNIFGTTYSNVTGIKATDTNNVVQTYIKPSGTKSITANGTGIDVTEYASVDVSVPIPSPTSSNIVIGSFTTGSTRNTRAVVTIPYTGTGYPIALHVYIKNGVYNNGTGGNTTWYNSVSNRYDVGWFTMTKARQNTAPTYDTSGEDNYGCTLSVYKNSTSSATTYGRNLLMTANTYSSSSGSASGLSNTLIFRGSGTSLQYYIGNGSSSTGGLAPSTEYTYIVVYSS